jgi:hypothetical protein
MSVTFGQDTALRGERCFHWEKAHVDVRRALNPEVVGFEAHFPNQLCEARKGYAPVSNPCRTGR